MANSHLCPCRILLALHSMGWLPGLEPLWLWRVCGVEAAAWYGLEIVAGCRLGLRGAMNRINAAQGFAFTQFFPFSVSFTLWVRRPPYFFGNGRMLFLMWVVAWEPLRTCCMNAKCKASLYPQRFFQLLTMSRCLMLWLRGGPSLSDVTLLYPLKMFWTFMFPFVCCFVVGNKCKV